ncbi:unnamed protein product, partial [Allacma fusca]
ILESTTLCGSDIATGDRSIEDIICCVVQADSSDDVIVISDAEEDIRGGDITNPWGIGGIHVVRPPAVLRPKLPSTRPVVAPVKPTLPPKRNATTPSGAGETESKCYANYVIVAAGTQPHPTKHSYPFMAAIINKKHNKQFCGGSLIDTRHVLTAAHCLEAFRTRESLRNLVIYLGSHDLSKDESASEAYSVATIYKHRGFNFQNLRDDVAIIKLSKSVDHNKYVQPICLSTASASATENKPATVAGWGYYCVKGCPTSPKLRHASVKVWTNSQCQSRYSQAQSQNSNVPTISSGMVCAGSPGNDACQGDSGGPLFVKENMMYRQVGVVSWGIDCGEYPGVYSRVSSYHSWIQKNIKR